VTDLGDDPIQLHKPDEDSPRARNLRGVLAALEALKPRVEQAVKSGALPLILGGDCSIALAAVAGARRYFRHVGLVYMDSDADLLTPGTTSSGCVDGMVISHIIGRGAAEMVRFWGEPPLVREPDIALFGVTRVEPAEEQVLQQSPLRRYLAADVQRKGAGAAAEEAIARIHGAGSEFILHLDVDVISDFQATNYPSTDGLLLREVHEALEVFAKQKHLAAIEICAYNPAKDSDGSGATQVIDLVVDVLAKRLEAQKAATAPEPIAAAAGVSEGQASAGAPPAAAPVAEGEPALPAPKAGEAWSPESLEIEPESSGNEPHKEAENPDESQP